LKIFKNIRKASLNNKKILNYLGYAIGEIILVVIGILIDVTLNNSNEEYKESKQLENIFAIIKTNLKNDIQNINKVQEYYEVKKDYSI